MLYVSIWVTLYCLIEDEVLSQLLTSHSEEKEK